MFKVLLISLTIIFIGCSDSLKQTKDFSEEADLSKRENARPAYSEDRDVFLVISTFIPSILLMPIFLVQPLPQMMLIDLPVVSLLSIH